MEYRKQDSLKIEYLAFARKSEQEPTVFGPRTAGSMERKCSANARERILHRRGASRISNSAHRPSNLLFSHVTVSPFLSFLLPPFLPCSAYCRAVTAVPKIEDGAARPLFTVSFSLVSKLKDHIFPRVANGAHARDR